MKNSFLFYLIAILIVVFIVCWCPFSMLVLVNGFCGCVRNGHLITLVKFMHYSNSAFNPLVYVWYNEQYRKAFLRTVTKFAHKRGAEVVLALLHTDEYDEQTNKLVSGYSTEARV